jgi:hypothetical protein
VVHAHGALILLWRARAGAARAPLPRRWVVAAVLVLAVGLTLWSERTCSAGGRRHLLVVLMSLKTLELRARRDALVVFFLGFFLVLTHFLYSQSLAPALWMLVSVWGLLTALVLAHMPVGRPPLWRAGALAARAALLGVPVMVVMFVLFPRMAPLWGLPQDAAGRTGLSGSLQLGGVASIANDDSIAMRVRFFGRVPDPGQLYFRGPVLSSFDGREWTRLVPSFPAAAAAAAAELQLRGPAVRYELTLEPSRLALLPMLEMTPDRPDAAPDIEGWTLTLRPTRSGRSTARSPSACASRHGLARAPARPAQRCTRPARPGGTAAGRQPARAAWARRAAQQPRAGQADARTLAAGGAEHIRRGLHLHAGPGPYGRDAVDEFWFDRKLGFCEHFAGAFVVMMRALDVPARIVTGYQGATPSAGRLLRGAPEPCPRLGRVLAAGAGWVRADPTAAVAPDRIQASRSLEPARGLVAGALGSVNPELAAQPARPVGGGEQPLEPVGAELLAQPAVRPAARAGLCVRPTGVTSPTA